ncbi:phosphatidylinositol-binding protein scs2 [Serendipita sp. 399]|nr:phosphatidylinositol-binding protein scs2 [Serendipita sp. 399]
MSVSLDPSSQLAFRSTGRLTHEDDGGDGVADGYSLTEPFTTLGKQILQVYNYNAQPVAFKVKTTAPKLYCVRPNAGRIEPGMHVDVSVLLQPMKEDPPLSVKCKDKFLVQSLMIPQDKNDLAVNDFWSSLSGEESARIHQQKLRVVYLPAEGTLREEDEHEVGQSSMITEGESTLHRYETVKQHNGHLGDTSNTHIPIFDNEPGIVPATPPRAHTPDHLEYANAHEQSPEAHHPEPVPIISPSAPGQTGVGSVSTIPRVSYDHNAEYAAKLAEANAEINRLRALLSNNNSVAAKRRTIFSDDGTSVVDGATDAGLDDSASVIGSSVKPDGVPLNVVAMVSVLVFVITYLFF